MRLTTLRADLLLLAAAVIWGSGFVAQRLGSEHLDAFEYNGLRFTLGTLLLLPMLRFAPWPAHASRADARRGVKPVHEKSARCEGRTEGQTNERTSARGDAPFGVRDDAHRNVRVNE